MPRHRWLSGTTAIRALLLLAGLTSGALAGPPANWVATSVRGTVLMLSEGEWVEITQGESVTGGEAVRTLQAGRVQLQRGRNLIVMAPNTAVQLDAQKHPGRIRIDQYSGALDIAADKATHFTVHTPAFTAETAGGALEVRVGAGNAGLSVRSGAVVVIGAKGAHATVEAGQALNGAAGQALQVTSAPSAGPPAAEPAAAAPGPAGPTGIGGPAPSGPANGVPGGPAPGGPGNGGPGGPAPGGPGNGGPGGAGNGNAGGPGGGPGNGNAGNGNAGGNGNGNGHVDGKGN